MSSTCKFVHSHKQGRLGTAKQTCLSQFTLESFSFRVIADTLPMKITLFITEVIQNDFKNATYSRLYLYFKRLYPMERMLTFALFERLAKSIKQHWKSRYTLKAKERSLTVGASVSSEETKKLLFIRGFVATPVTVPLEANLKECLHFAALALNVLESAFDKFTDFIGRPLHMNYFPRRNQHIRYTFKQNLDLGGMRPSATRPSGSFPRNPFIAPRRRGRNPNPFYQPIADGEQFITLRVKVVRPESMMEPIEVDVYLTRMETQLLARYMAMRINFTAAYVLPYLTNIVRDRLTRSGSDYSDLEVIAIKIASVYDMSDINPEIHHYWFNQPMMGAAVEWLFTSKLFNTYNIENQTNDKTCVTQWLAQAWQKINFNRALTASEIEEQMYELVHARRDSGFTANHVIMH